MHDPGAPRAALGEEELARIRRPPRGPRRPSGTRRPPGSSRSGSCCARSRRNAWTRVALEARARRRPGARARAGPAMRALLGDVADEHERGAVRLRRGREQRRALAHLRDRARRRLDALASRSVWIESTSTSGGLESRATGSASASTRVSASTTSASGSDGEALGAQPDLLGALLARRRRGRAAARARPAASWSASVDFPMPGSPPSSTTEPGTSPPPSTRSSSAMPVARRGTASASISREPARLRRPRTGSAREQLARARRRAGRGAPRRASTSRRSPGSARASAAAARRTRCTRRRCGPPHRRAQLGTRAILVGANHCRPPSTLRLTAATAAF